MVRARAVAMVRASAVAMVRARAVAMVRARTVAMVRARAVAMVRARSSGREMQSDDVILFPNGVFLFPQKAQHITTLQHRETLSQLLLLYCIYH